MKKETFIGAGAGAILSWLFPYIISIPSLIVRFVVKEPLPVLGTWHGCHYTREGGVPALKRDLWTFRRRLRGGGYKVRVSWGVPTGVASLSRHKRKSSGVRSKGSAVREIGHLVVSVAWGPQRESVSARLEEPVAGGATPVYGLWGFFDFDGNLTCGPVVLTRDEVPDLEAARLLNSGLKVISTHRLLGRA